MDAARSLTWHAGSVLPFASLWHTLHRVMSLNAMRTKELPQLLEGSWQMPSVRSVDTHFNEVAYGYGSDRSSAVNTRQLACTLGEPAHAFEWSHLGRLPLALRNLVLPKPRLCPICAAQGYHSALFSIRALDRCPIHQCNLVSHCRCGQEFEPTLRVGQATFAGQCRCGQVAYFTKETCRRPRMATDDVRPMQAVAAWMEDLCTVVRPWGHSRLTQELHDRVFRASWGKWSRYLGLNPLQLDASVTSKVDFAFDSLEIKNQQYNPSFPMGKALQPAPANHEPLPQGRASMWQHSEATVAYRAMLRHIRRHVGRHADQFALEFLGAPDPLAMADRMRTNPQAMVAFAELLFCCSMEKFAMERRWPYRKGFQAAQWPIFDRLSDPLRSAGGGPERPMPKPAREWIARQVAARTVSHAWRRAQQCAMAAIRNGLADWRCATEAANGIPRSSGGLVETWNWHSAPPPYQITWAASVSVNRLRFVSFPATLRLDWTMPTSSKAGRQQAWSVAQAQRAAHRHRSTQGPTLRWTAREGWHVTASTFADPASAVRHRLFMPHGQRLWVLLSATVSGFSVRSCDQPLEVAAATPREAFSAMRHALATHCARYGASTLIKASRRRRPEPDPLSADSPVYVYRAHLQQIWNTKDFWSGAASCNLRAHSLLAADLRLPAAARRSVVLDL